MTTEDSIQELSKALVMEFQAAGKSVATAESCTGGWIAKSITDVAGSSACFGYGIVSYSNDAKQSVLGVSATTLDEHGAVSDEVVQQMARGALRISGADLSVAVSGIAGPDGGTADKPVGTVWFGWCGCADGYAGAEAERRQFEGDRESVRAQAVVFALQGLRERLRETVGAHG